ncbi:MAG: low affinity iron permease family protein [Candidatus Limnocylindrales bacterium]
MDAFFTRVAKWTARAAGHPTAFVMAVLVIVVWALTGPIFGFSDTWQLVINTGTTIATFLMVFLIQNTQNRDTAALQIKLDELIRVQLGAHNATLDLEELTEQQLEKVRARYEALAHEARMHLERGEGDTDQPELAE